jgi:hypothetical protein
MTKIALTLAATLILSAGAAAAQDRVLTVINNSAATLTELYTSPANSDTWGDDLMQGQTLATGETGELTIADGSEECAYSVRAVFDDGNEIEGETDVCSTDGFTLN